MAVHSIRCALKRATLGTERTERTSTSSARHHVLPSISLSLVVSRLVLIAITSCSTNSSFKLTTQSDLRTTITTFPFSLSRSFIFPLFYTSRLPTQRRYHVGAVRDDAHAWPFCSCRHRYVTRPRPPLKSAVHISTASTGTSNWLSRRKGHDVLALTTWATSPSTVLRPSSNLPVSVSDLSTRVDGRWMVDPYPYYGTACIPSRLVLPFRDPEFETLQLHAGCRSGHKRPCTTYLCNLPPLSSTIPRYVVMIFSGIIMAISHGTHDSTPQICLAFLHSETFILALGTRQ